MRNRLMDETLCDKLDDLVRRTKKQHLDASVAFESCAEWMDTKSIDVVKDEYPIFYMRVTDYMNDLRRMRQKIRDSETIYEDTEVIVVVTWSGGWDRYKVDTRSIREVTVQEQQTLNNLGNNTCKYPTMGKWLKGKFLQKPSVQALVKITRDECVRIVEHLGGGNLK